MSMSSMVKSGIFDTLQRLMSKWKVNSAVNVRAVDQFIRPTNLFLQNSTSLSFGILQQPALQERWTSYLYRGADKFLARPGRE
jgi:hypothetical protein